MTQTSALPNPGARKRMNRYARAAALPIAIMSASFSASALAACSPCKGRCRPCAAKSACRANPCASVNPAAKRRAGFRPTKASRYD